MLGALTSIGCDAFELFAHNEKGDRFTLDDVQERWDEIDRKHEGVITKTQAAHYLAKKSNRNPLTLVMRWLSHHSRWRNSLLALVGVMIGIAVIKGLALFWSQYLKEIVTVKVSRDLRWQYFDHIHKMPLEFYQKYDVGSLSSRINIDSLQIAEGISAGMTAFLQTPFTLISSIILCLYISVPLSLFVFLSFPVFILPLIFFAKRVKKTSRHLLRNNERLTRVLIESFSGIQTIKLFAKEAFTLSRFHKQNQEMAGLQTKSARYAYLARPILHMASILLLAGIMLFGIFVANLRLAEILVFCGLAYLMYEPIKKLADENLRVQRGVAAAERMQEVMQIEPKITDREGAIELTEFKESIEFDDVWFRYGDRWVLRGVSFTVQKGEVVALVGATGAGKSTLVHLLPRLYEPEKGEIRIDGRPLHDYTQSSLRRLAAFVPQKPFFFLDTVAENIAFGSQYSKSEIIQAASRAHADEFIEALPRKYETLLAEGAKDLSGGQQQRLAIARALVCQAPILVLDEATSSLDAVSEAKIKKATNDLRGSITQLIIAHRLSTIEDADKILFLEDGAVTAQGTKDELLESCAGFREMWDLMMSRKDRETSPHFSPSLVKS